uniref:Uncharacterized protein n=1 Tax=Arundo donax TaxID=35708 RepID=A0A0A8XWG9_ARUDO
MQDDKHAVPSCRSNTRSWSRYPSKPNLQRRRNPW